MIHSDYLDHYSKGFEYFVFEGKIKEALIEYKKVIRLKPDYSKVYFDIGFIYGTIGKPGCAVRYLKKYLNFSHSLSEMKETSEMITQLNKKKAISIC